MKTKTAENAHIPTNKISWVYDGSKDGYYVLIDDEQTYFTKKKKKRDLFISELTLRKNRMGQNETNDLLNVDEAAAFLGITKATLYLKTSRKEVPFSRVPGTKKLWFSRERLINWIKSYK